MALDSEEIAEWLTDFINADAPLAAIIGANKAFREPIPDEVALPAIAIGVWAEGQRVGAIKSGPNTHTGTVVLMRVSVWDELNYTKVKQAARRLDLILDGARDQTRAEGYIFSCHRVSGAIARRVTPENENTQVGFDIPYRVFGKAT